MGPNNDTTATETTTGAETPDGAAAATEATPGQTLLTTQQTTTDGGDAPPAEGDAPTKTGEDDAAADGAKKDGEGAEGDGPAPELFGAPAEDAEYEVNLPDGVTLDKPMMDAVTPLFRELNLSNAGAQRFIDAYIEQVQPALAQQIVAQIEADAVQHLTDSRNAAETAMKADATLPKEEQLFGGATQADISRMAAKAMDKFGSPEFRTFLDSSGLGNDLSMIRLLYNVGKGIAEDTGFPRGGGGEGRKLTREEKFYGVAG